MQKITIMRKWNNPTISVTVNDESISLEMPLADFREALKADVGKNIMIKTPVADIKDAVKKSVGNREYISNEPDELIESLCTEVGSVTFVFQEETFRTRMKEAFGKVLKTHTIDEDIEAAVDAVTYTDTVDNIIDKSFEFIVEEVKKESTKVI